MILRNIKKLLIVNCYLLIAPAVAIDCGTNGCVVCATDLHITAQCISACSSGMGGSLCTYKCKLNNSSIEHSGDYSSTVHAECNATCRRDISSSDTITNGKVYASCEGGCGVAHQTYGCRYTCPIIGDDLIFSSELECENACVNNVKTSQNCTTGTYYTLPHTCQYELCRGWAASSNSTGNYKYTCS